MAVKRSGEQFAHLPSGIDICYETFGRKSDPVVLLIMGLGGPMGWWSDEFCEQLAERGYRVVRYDNRDTGRSTKLRQHRVRKVDILRAAIGLGANAAYGLEDLAADAAGLLDDLGVKKAHVAGVSMGGMIGQILAITYPDRVLSLTSIMSTTGKRTVGWQHPKVLTAMLASAGRTREEYVARALRTARIIGSPEYPTDEERGVHRAEETYDRGWTASGVARHMMAVLTASDRTAALRAVRIPTTVVHGLDDPLVHRSGGRATHKAIDGSELVEIPGMGHDLPVELYPNFIDAIVKTAERA